MRLTRETNDRELAALGLDRRAAAPETRHLLRLLEALDLELEVARIAAPNVWLAATVDAASRSVCLGKGWDAATAVVRCLGELAERRSTPARNDEPRCDPRGRKCLGPADLFGFSPAQRADHARLNSLWRGYDVVPGPDALVDPIAWCEVEPLTGGEAVLAPFSFCYAVSDPAGRMLSVVSDSTGCAAGPTIAAAKHAALLEIVERDAAGIWWYGRCRRPGIRIDPERCPDLAAALAARDSARPIWFLDLTHDLGPAVVAAISCDAERGLPAIGLAASDDVARAAETAFLELCQGELNLALCLRRWASRIDRELTADEQSLRDWLRAMTPERLAWTRPCAERNLADIVSREVTPATLSLRGLKAWWLDLTRADVGVPTVRVIVPGAATLRPRLGSDRFPRVPVELGWQPHGFTLPDLGELPPIGF